MKKNLVFCIALLLIASFSLSLISCDTVEQNGTTDTTIANKDIGNEPNSQETTDTEIKETVSQETTDIEIEETFSQEITDIEIEEIISQETTDYNVNETTVEETTEDDDFPFITPVNPRQIFSSLDKLLLAVEDTDAYCDKVQKDSYGRPIDPEFIKEIIELLKPILIPYTDEFSSFSLKVEKSYVYGYYNVGIVFTTENDIKYVFDAYFNIGELEYPYNYEPEKIPDEESCELKIDNQFVKMHMFQNSYRGVWKNGDVCFEVHVYGKNLTSPEDLIDFYTVDLVELASQRYGEETTEDDYQGCVPMDKRQQIFNSLDELLLAIEDIDAFCEIVTDNGEGEPVEPEFIKEKLSFFSDYPFALIDNCSSIWAELTHNGLQIVLTSKGGTDYTFIYWFDADSFHLANGEVFGEFKIDDQYIKMYSFSNLVGLKYSYVGVWTNNDMPVFVGVAGDSEELKSPESFQDQEIYTVDLFELASQRYGEETTEDDYQGCVPMDKRQQIFNSLDELLLAIEDIDAFCEVVTDNGEGEPVEPEFISEKLSLLNNYPIALIDNYSSFWAQLTHNVLYIMIFEEGTRYEFIYWFEADCVSRGNGDFFGELKIDDQYIEMYPRSYNSGLKYTYEGAWENNGMLVLVYVSGDSEELKTPESFQDQEIYTVDLFELASQIYGEETTSEESDAEGSETESIETESSIAN